MAKKNLGFVGLIVVVFILMSSFGVLADNISSCDYVISSPGEYVVTENLFSNVSDCIVINSSDVVLDCDDFVLDGNGVVGASGINVSDVVNVTVRNCEVDSFDAYGVVLNNVNGSVFEGLSLDGNLINEFIPSGDKGGLSLFGSNGNSFDDIVVMNDWWDNLYLLESSGNVFDNCLFDYAYDSGITLLLSDDNVFDGVNITTPYLDGIDVLESDNNVIKNSLISGADDGGEGGVGVYIDASNGSLFYRNIFDNPVNVDVSSAGVGNVWNSSVGNYWYGFSDSCNDSNDDGICDDVYDFSDGVVAIDYMPFDNLEMISFSKDVELNYSEWGNDSTNFSEFNDWELEDLMGVVFENSYGRILFLESVGIFGNLVLDGNVVISGGRVFVNSSELTGFDVPAELSLYNLSFNVPRVLRDGAVCSDCFSGGYSNGTFVFNVSGFSEYVVEEGSCFDGVQDYGESGVDCGGNCAACPSKHHHSSSRVNSGDVSPVVENSSNESVVNNVSEEGENVSSSEKDEVVSSSDKNEIDEEFNDVISGNAVSFNSIIKNWWAGLGVAVLISIIGYFIWKKSKSN